MADSSSETVWLTQDAYDQLAAELNDLKVNGRAEVSARIAAARDEGDLSENGGYHAAREEQGQMEGRIRQLEDLLRRAQVGGDHGEADEVAAGKVVTIAFDGDEDDTETFLLGSREVLGTDDSIDQVVSPQSAMGAALLGARPGDDVDYQTPTGKTLSVRVMQVRSL
ncbi:MAG: transcription elongation factor GreA [Propionibacterium sp.]|nr:MAG: transcription elongation factor GreA [Propionibacterium sp.]